MTGRSGGTTPAAPALPGSAKATALRVLGLICLVLVIIGLLQSDCGGRDNENAGNDNSADASAGEIPSTPISGVGTVFAAQVPAALGPDLLGFNRGEFHYDALIEVRFERVNGKLLEKTARLRLQPGIIYLFDLDDRRRAYRWSVDTQGVGETLRIVHWAPNGALRSDQPVYSGKRIRVRGNPPALFLLTVEKAVSAEISLSFQ